MKIDNDIKNIKLLILDVDGVLTDGKIVIIDSSEQLKNFNVKDGLGIFLIQKIGIKVAIITSNISNIVLQRLISLGLDSDDVLQGQKNKLKAYEILKSKYNLNDDNIAYMGDDLPDLILMNKVAISSAPRDAINIVKDYANYVCENNSGNGAVREFCDYIIKKLNKYDNIISDYIKIGEVV